MGVTSISIDTTPSFDLPVKRWMYEESFRTPLIMKWPGKIKAGSRFEQLVQNIDYAPTLLDIAGISIPSEVQGESLKPILDGKSPENWRSSLLYTYYGSRSSHNVKMHYGIRTRRHKLIHFPGTDEWELYDLDSDPSEMTNLYNREEYSRFRTGMEKELKQLMETYDVTMDPSWD